jgi:serine/threonine protein kinase
VLEGLDYAHRRADEADEPLGIVHRDVSPSNVLISYDGEVKLCDFGIAHANDLVREGANEALKGKAGYMSPEHARGDAIDARADVFAAGIILWELLAGRRLYRPRSEIPLLEQARRAEIPPLPDKGLAKAEELERIVMRALASDRDARYPSAGALLRDLEAYLAQAGLQANRLKLGEWMAETFGTELIERRRASERRLPKSNPPPRSSERVRASKAAESASSAIFPAAARVPPDLAETLDRDDLPVLPRAVEDEPAKDEAAAPPEREDEPAKEPLSERPTNVSRGGRSERRPAGLATLPISAGAMRAFRETLQEDPPSLTLDPAPSAGATMDAHAETEPAPGDKAKPAAASAAAVPAEDAGRRSVRVSSDAEMLAWARKRGRWAMAFFVTVIVALLVALAWHLMH